MASEAEGTFFRNYTHEDLVFHKEQALDMADVCDRFSRKAGALGVMTLGIGLPLSVYLKSPYLDYLSLGVAMVAAAIGFGLKLSSDINYAELDKAEAEILRRREMLLGNMV
jgi:hypothetical protein